MSSSINQQILKSEFTFISLSWGSHEPFQTHCNFYMIFFLLISVDFKPSKVIRLLLQSETTDLQMKCELIWWPFYFNGCKLVSSFSFSHKVFVVLQKQHLLFHRLWFQMNQLFYICFQCVRINLTFESCVLLSSAVATFAKYCDSKEINNVTSY